MIEEYIRNIDPGTPLGVIGLFAALAAIAGSIALPFIKEKDVQIKFVLGFLVPFPFAVLILFFATLYFKHAVFYVPNDFDTDDAFIRAIEVVSSDHKMELVGIHVKSNR